MSILIKGMDKPTDCGLCPFEDFGYCNVKGERNTSESGIDTDCPLIEVADRKTEPNCSEIPNNCEVKNYCDDCLYADTCDSKEFFYACTSKATISKMEQVDKDINVRSKDEPQWTKENCKGCKYNEYPYDSGTCFVRVCINGNKYEPKDEPQTDCAWK